MPLSLKQDTFWAASLASIVFSPAARDDEHRATVARIVKRRGFIGCFLLPSNSRIQGL